MLCSFLLMFLLVGAITSHPDPGPMQHEELEIHPQPVTPHVVKLIKVKPRANYKLLGYVRSLKSELEEQLAPNFSFLNQEETDRVQAILNEFMERFIVDLQKVLARSKVGKEYRKKEIDDGFEDSVFLIVKHRFKSELPVIGESGAEELVYRLRRNLMWTRFKIDSIIYESRSLSSLEESGYEGLELAIAGSTTANHYSWKQLYK